LPDVGYVVIFVGATAPGRPLSCQWKTLVNILYIERAEKSRLLWKRCYCSW